MFCSSSPEMFIITFVTYYVRCDISQITRQFNMLKLFLHEVKHINQFTNHNLINLQTI